MDFNIIHAKHGISRSPQAEILTRLWVRLTDLNSSAWIGVICLGTLQALAEPVQASERSEPPPEAGTEQAIPDEPESHQSSYLVKLQAADFPKADPPSIGTTLVNASDTADLQIPLVPNESADGFNTLVKNDIAIEFKSVRTAQAQTEPLRAQAVSELADADAVADAAAAVSPVDWSAPIETEFTGTVPPLLAQTPDDPDAATSTQASDLIQTPLIHVQGAYLLQDSDSSARARVTGTYALSPHILVGATVDLTTGDAFSDSREEGLNLNELYVAVSPEGLPGLRFTLGLLDLTSYFDRNSFAKDSLTHFFNPVFQTNPALAATGIASRPSVLVTWNATDNLEIKAAGFSSSRNLGELELNGFAGEVGLRFGNLIVRGTYVTDEDAGQEDGFREIFQFPRGDDDFGLLTGDREDAYGLNAEFFVPELNLGLFGRYGHYENRDLDRGGDTVSFGMNLLDLFLPDDRLGLGYGRQLSNNGLRRDDNDKVPDVLELFYDVRLTPNLRMGASLQERNGFSETIFGFRVRADFDL